MRIYIAGKVTGDENYREKFNQAEKALASIGHEPINPACLQLPKSCSWKDYMSLTLRMLDLADAVCLLPDWKESRGACVEYGYAVAKDKIIVYAEEILPEPAANADPVRQPVPPPSQNRRKK